MSEKRHYKVALIGGDGIGPEICEATMQVIAAAGVNIEWEEVLAGQQAFLKYGTPLSTESIRKLLQYQHVLKAPLAAEKCGNGVRVEDEKGCRVYPSVNNALRRELQCFANIRPVQGWKGISGRYEGLNLVLIREVTEDIYLGEERQLDADTAEATKRITRQASERVGRLACEYARRYQRRRVTAVHKANVLHRTDGLFLKAVRDVVSEFSDLVFDDMMVDAACYHLVKSPGRFDVMVLTNQYGDILSDMAAGLAGSLGLAPGVNLGPRVALYEAAHGAAPDIAAKGIVNPIGFILCGALLLEDLPEPAAADLVRTAVAAVLEEGRWLTPDLGGRSSTQDLTAALCDRVAKLRQT